MLRLHKREMIVKEAELKLMDFLAELRKGLTEGEYLRVITGELAGEWASTAKYMIREERHPNEPDREGGIE